MRRLLTVALIGAGLLAGCARREEPPPAPRPPREAPRPPAVRAAPSAAEYVERAASIDLFTIRAAEMALSRADDPRLRDLAGDLADGHRGTSSQLSLAGRRLNLLPDTSLQPLHQRMLDELVLAVNFDHAWGERLVAVHREAVDLHGLYAARGASPTLRPVAAAALAVERRHLQRLRGS